MLAPGHCAECHTPRTFYGVLEWDRAFAGAQLGKEKVPNITCDSDQGPGQVECRRLRHRAHSSAWTPNGDFVGSEMAKVVNNGTSKLPEADVAAIVAYLQSLPSR